MLAKVKTAAVVGLDAQEVEVEVDILSGLPAVKMGWKPLIPQSGSCREA